MAEIAVKVAIEVLKKTSSIILDLIAAEGSRLSRLQEEISWVEREMKHIQFYLKDVEHKQGENGRLANLLADIRDLAFDVEDTMEKYIPIPLKKKGFRGFFERVYCIFSDSNNAHNFLMEIEVIKRRVKDINRVRKTYGITECNDQDGIVEKDRWEENRSFSHVDEPNVTGFGNHIKNLIAKIQDENPKLCVISIFGIAGVGKTTLAKKIYNSLCHSISLTAWVYVSQQPIVKNILQDIARQVGLQVDRWDENGEAILFERLSHHRYLIVIDDIWETRTWNILKNAIPTESRNSSRILLTSRNRDVGVHIGGWNSLYGLEPLDERYSKHLFKTSMGPPQTENDTHELDKIGEIILRRCAGLPLAIVLVAGLLKLKVRSESAWNGVLEQMDKAQGEYSKIFASSYIDLPSYLKPCFLYLGIFPEDHEINTFDLINLWAAEGFIEGSGVREVEDVGDDYLNLLIARNLVQVVRKGSNEKVKSCRIHDILRGLCLQKAEDLNFFYRSSDLIKYKGVKVRRITTQGTGLRDRISSNHRTSNLRSYLCFNNIDMKLLQDFPKALNYLRVARFHVDSPFSMIPWGFRNLTYLKLQNDGGLVCFPKNIIVLESLVTLDLQGFGWGFYFPMVIWNMKRLRHLLLPNKRKFMEDIDRISIKDKYPYQGFNQNAISFLNFQTLVVRNENLYNTWLHEFSNLRTLKIMGYQEVAELLLTSSVVLNNLKNLRLEPRSSKGMKISVSTLNLLSYEKLSKLCLKKIDIDQCPHPDEFPPNLIKLVLIETQLNGDPLEIMKKIPKLRVLKLVNGFYDRKQMVCTGGFSQLEELVIISDAAAALEIAIENRGMPRLKKLFVRVLLKPIVPPRIDDIMDFSRSFLEGQFLLLQEKYQISGINSQTTLPSLNRFTTLSKSQHQHAE